MRVGRANYSVSASIGLHVQYRKVRSPEWVLRGSLGDVPDTIFACQTEKTSSCVVGVHLRTSAGRVVVL